MNKTKLLGQTFTEYREVSKMLDMFNGDIAKAKIMEPSFGDGAFLLPIVQKIIRTCKKRRKSDQEIAKILNNNIYGFELDKKFYKFGIQNLQELVIKEKVEAIVEFKNLHNDDTFICVDDNFDLVIGNPPYVRIQNLNNNHDNIRSKLKRTTGNTDLFLLFIDFYLSKLAKNGQMIFIVPNTLGKSKSAEKIRNWMKLNGSIQYIDFESEQLFKHASVYSSILKYSHNDVFLNSNFRVGHEGKQMSLDLNSNNFQPKNYDVFKIAKDFQVKNGIATLSDSIFIYEEIDLPNVEKEFVIKTFKGSRPNKQYFSLFPYKIIDKNVERFKNDMELKKMAPKLYAFLINHKKKLLSRSLEKTSHWFEYGRSQAIKDVMHSKIVINTLIAPGQTELKIKKIPKKTLVFSGLYSISNDLIEENSYNLIKHLRFKAKDMRGGYKKISSSLLKNDIRQN